MPYLVHRHQSRALGPGVLIIGSGTEAAWRILEHDLLPMHAIVMRDGDGAVSVVQGTPDAAVLVNGKEIEGGWHRLAFGDRILLNNAEFLFQQFAEGERHSRDIAYLNDARRGRLFRLREVTTIGRDLASVVLLQDPEVSRTHAEVRREDKGFVMHPRGGVTLVNGERLVTPRVLQEGDQIFIGRTKMRFSTDVPSGASAMPDAKVPGGANKQAARMATTYIGVVESRARLDRSRRRRFATYAGIVAAGCAALLLLVSAIFRALQ